MADLESVGLGGESWLIMVKTLVVQVVSVRRP